MRFWHIWNKDETWKHAKWKSHTQKDKYFMISLMWNLRITKFIGVESRLKVTRDLRLGKIEGERGYCFMLTRFPYKGVNSFGPMIGAGLWAFACAVPPCWDTLPSPTLASPHRRCRTGGDGAVLGLTVGRNVCLLPAPCNAELLAQT